MIFNLTDSFKNIIQEENSFVSEFIESAQVRLLGCGVHHSDSSAVSNFMLSAFLLVYYREGTVEIRHGESATVLKPGSLYIFKPYEVYSGIRLEKAAITFSFLQFEVTPYIPSYNLMKTALSLEDAQFSGSEYRRIGIVLNELVDREHTVGQKALLEQLAKWTAIWILSDRLNFSDKPVLLKRSSESRLINLAVQYVSDHLSQPIVIGAIVQSIGTSRTSLERAFKNAFGLSPQQALLRFKIERSFEKLQENAPIKKVAKELGFSSEYHFSNAFYNIMGIRPSEYKLQAASRLDLSLNNRKAPAPPCRSKDEDAGRTPDCPP